MTDPMRQSAEATYRAVSDDLRFADAKALFIALVVGAWANAVFNAIGFKDLDWSTMASPFHSILIGFAVAVCVSLVCALWAIVPRMPLRVEGSVHRLQSLADMNKASNGGHETVLAAFEPEKYEKSLLSDLGRVGKRCVQKYFWVKVSALFAFASLLLGVGLLFVKLRA